MYKKFNLKDCKGFTKIIITSVNNEIDFAKESTHIMAYFNNKDKPEYSLYAELKIIEKNQPITTVLELPIKGINCEIRITSYTDYDMEKLKIFMR